MLPLGCVRWVSTECWDNVTWNTSSCHVTESRLSAVWYGVATWRRSSSFDDRRREIVFLWQSAESHDAACAHRLLHCTPGVTQLLNYTLSLSILMAIFSLCWIAGTRRPGLAQVTRTRMSLFWFLLELRMVMVVATGAISRAKLQSNRHHQQTKTQFYTCQMSFL